LWLLETLLERRDMFYRGAVVLYMRRGLPSRERTDI